MKLYRHYKNKFYRLLGEVRHSETGESLALYETMYDSPGGKTWVRPKAMFHETVEWPDGEQRPRFAPVEVKIETHASKYDDWELAVAEAAGVGEIALGRLNLDDVRKRLSKAPRFNLLLAKVDDLCVAFKLGYELSQDVFYSWLGGVNPEFRGNGIANELMRQQHEWCRKIGYKRVQTKTLNERQAMITLNLKHGFNITGTEPAERGLKIVMEKALQ
jgi:GNAT superfamily N-acetyltransferase